MLLYAENITPRLEYIVDYLFKERMGVEVNITNNLEKAIGYKKGVIGYSADRIGDFWLKPEGILEEGMNLNYYPSVSGEGESFLPFSNESDIGFDLFSATFYLLSRMEEYTGEHRDQHDRFKGLDSFLYKNNVHLIPVVDLWVERLRVALDKMGVETKTEEFREIITIDIDNAYAYKFKPAWKMFGANVRDFLKGNRDLVNQRKAVLKGKLPDPYDNYDYVKALSKKYDKELIYFILIGNKGGVDNNISISVPEIQKLYKNLSNHAKIGLHPSYASNNSPNEVAREKKLLEECIGREIKSSRQHFLKIKLPETYRNIIDKGIENDYSMGYSDLIGFRAGTSRPFFWYDLNKEEKTTLKVHPFVYMDGTLNEYMRLSQTMSKKMVIDLKNKIKETNGIYISIWHNETLSNNRHWDGWKDVLEAQLEN